MAWEWVQPVCTAVVVVVTVSATAITAKGSREHVERATREANAHAERLSATERREQHLVDAYLDMLELIERTGHFVDRVYPVFDTIPPQPVPPIPDAESQIRVRARLAAFGSPDVLKLWDEYGVIVRKVTYDVMVIQDGQENEDRESSPTSARVRLHREHRPAERAKRTELQRQVARELQSDTPAI